MTGAVNFSAYQALTIMSILRVIAIGIGLVVSDGIGK